jgi:hypothetical protein
LKPVVEDIRRQTQNVTEHNDEALTCFILNAQHPATSASAPPSWWLENKDEIIESAVDQVAGLEEWYEMQEELLEFSQEVKMEFRGLKQEIRTEYGINPEDPSPPPPP